MSESELPTGEAVVTAFLRTEIVPVWKTWALRTRARDEPHVPPGLPCGCASVALARAAGITEAQLAAWAHASFLSVRIALALGVPVDYINGLVAGWDGEATVIKPGTDWSAWAKGARAGQEASRRIRALLGEG